MIKIQGDISEHFVKYYILSREKVMIPTAPDPEATCVCDECGVAAELLLQAFDDPNGPAALARACRKHAQQVVEEKFGVPSKWKHRQSKAVAEGGWQDWPSVANQ